MRGRGRVVAERDEHQVAVAHGLGHVERRGAGCRAAARRTPPARRSGSSRSPRARPRPAACPRRACAAGSSTSCPDGVNTSTTSRRSAGNSGLTMWLIWRVALPAPRTSISTSSGRTSTGSRRRSQRAPQIATSPLGLDPVGGVARQVERPRHPGEDGLAAAELPPLVPRPRRGSGRRAARARSRRRRSPPRTSRARTPK